MKKYFIIVVCLSLLAFSSPAIAETKTFLKEYTYQASEFDSKASSRILALEQVKRLLLEELGTYLISETEVKDFQLTKDQIMLFTAGIVRADVLDEKWDGKTYYLKVKLSADPEEVAQSVKKISQDKKITKELEGTKKRADDLEKEVIRLRQELTTKADSVKIKHYSDTVKKLSAIEWMQKGFAVLKDGKDADKNKEAIEAFSKALELNPEYSDLYFLRASILYYFLDSKDYIKILSDIDKAITLHPSNIDNSAYKTTAPHLSMKAKIFLDRKDWFRAIQALEMAINLDPDEAITPSGVDPDKPEIGKAWSKKDFDEIIRRFPKDSRGYMFRGVYYYFFTTFDIKYFKPVIEDYNEAIRLNPKKPLIYYLLGKTYGIKTTYRVSQIDWNKDYQKAIEVLSKAIKLNPSYLEAYRERASNYLVLKEYEKAISDYDKILELDPDNGSRYFDRGLAYERLGQLEKAVQSFTSAMNAKKPMFSPLDLAYKKRAEVYILLGKNEKALEDSTKAIELRESFLKRIADLGNDFVTAGLYVLRGRIYSTIGLLKATDVYEKDSKYSPRDLPEYHDAIADFTKAINLFPDSSDAYEERSDVYAAIGNYQNTLQDLEMVIKIYQKYNLNPGRVYSKRAFRYINLGNLKQAIIDYSQAIDYGDQSFHTYYQRGGVFLTLENYHEAIKDFSETIKLSPKYEPAYLNRGIAYLNTGNHKASIVDFDKAVALSPSLGDAYFYRGLAQIRSNYIKGIDDFKIAARLGHKEAQDKLKSLNIEW